MTTFFERRGYVCSIKINTKYNIYNELLSEETITFWHCVCSVYIRCLRCTSEWSWKIHVTTFTKSLTMITFFEKSMYTYSHNPSKVRALQRNIIRRRHRFYHVRIFLPGLHGRIPRTVSVLGNTFPWRVNHNRSYVIHNKLPIRGESWTLIMYSLQ